VFYRNRPDAAALLVKFKNKKPAVFMVLKLKKVGRKNHKCHLEGFLAVAFSLNILSYIGNRNS